MAIYKKERFGIARKIVSNMTAESWETIPHAVVSYEADVTEFLKEYNLVKYFSDITNIKIPAYLIIDDRCINFKGNYNNLLEDIDSFRVWYK